MNECDCKSGNYKYPLYDGYGIFLCYACDSCEEEKLNQFRSDILECYETDEQIDEDY